MKPFHRNTTALLRLGAAGLAASMALAACGGSGDKTSTEGTGTTAKTPTTQAEGQGLDVNLTDRADVKDGGTLKWTLTEIPPNFNINELDGALDDNAKVLGGVMPYVFDFDASAQPILKKEYVTSAKVTAESPKQVVTYEINPKAKWNDGSPITVADYAAQATALSGKNEAFKISSANGYEKIESVVKGKDDHEVVVTFASPYADWQGLFSPLYPAATNSDPKVFNEGWTEKILMSAGPFKFQGVDQTAKTITLVRDDAWWGNKAKLDSIIFRAIDSDAQIDALANGEVDFIDVGPDVNKLQRAQSTSGVKVHKAAGPNFRHITLNGTSEVLKDVQVRKAIALAIDRTVIAKALIGPLGVDAVPLNNHIFMTNQKGYKNNAGDLAKPDPEKAKSLLDAAGWKLNGATRAKAGKPLTVRMVIPSAVATSKQESELLQGMLGAVGIKLDIVTVPSDDFFDKYITPGNFDMTVFSWIGTTFPISSSKSIYAEPKGDDIQQNFARIGTPELDALFDKATAEFDPDKAIDLANEIDTMIWDEVHSLTTYQRPNIVATRDNLANYGAFGFASAVYEDIGFTK